MKLNEQQVREIYYSTDQQNLIAERFGVTRGMVNSIKNRRSWKHLDLGEPGRSGRARNNPTRLFSHQVTEIAKSKRRFSYLATRYQVPVDIIKRIKAGVTWYHLYHVAAKTKRRSDGGFFKYQIKEIQDPMYTIGWLAERYQVPVQMIEEVRDAQ